MHDNTHLTNRQQASMKHTVNIAIMGAGRMASHMAHTLELMNNNPEYRENLKTYAVVSRSLERAQAMANTYGFATAYGSYQELLDDPKVDLVYIATPHSLHEEQALACLNRGKNVLIEKSFALNATQSQRIINKAQHEGLLCAEAIWTRYMPSRYIMQEVINSGQLGDIRGASANLCYPTTGKPRMTDLTLGGGALLDVGVYALNFLDMIFPSQHINHISSTASLYATGVDETNSTTITYENGALGIAMSSMTVASDRTGTVWGSKGYMVCRNINNIESIETYDLNHELVQSYSIPEQLTGYEYEVDAALQAVLNGDTECKEMPHRDTIRIMEQMDTIRQIWGLHYPNED